MDVLVNAQCAMELIHQFNSVKGVPANVTIPDTFRCPICDKEKTSSLPANEISDRTFLPMGARFGVDYGFYNQTSIRGLPAFSWLRNMSLNLNGSSANNPKNHQLISCSGLSVNYVYGLASPSWFCILMGVVNYGVAMSSGIVYSTKPIA
jgi:hypothetical protein